MAHGQEQEWENGLCGCFSNTEVCCLGTWLPCIIYGRTQHRLRNGNLQDFSFCNGSCIVHGLFPIIRPFLQCMQRSEVREKYNLEGNGCSDCMKVFCCPCCALIQEENEVRDREEKANMRGYNTPAPMAYGASQPADGKPGAPPQAHMQNGAY